MAEAHLPPYLPPLEDPYKEVMALMNWINHISEGSLAMLTFGLSVGAYFAKRWYNRCKLRIARNEANVDLILLNIERMERGRLRDHLNQD